MRIWDVSQAILCRPHLLGEHRELHAVWTVLSEGKQGYARHPETLRWQGKLTALFARHQSLVREMEHRGYRHQSPLDPSLATGLDRQDAFVDSYETQLLILREKGCECRIHNEISPAE